MTEDSKSKLENYVNRIERLEDDKSDIAGDIKNVYDEAASDGYDKKVLKELIKRRKKAREEIEYLDEALHTYELALEGKSEITEIIEKLGVDNISVTLANTEVE